VAETEGERCIVGELLHEFRAVATGLAEVLQRTARLETKVDRLARDSEEAARMQRRLGEIEGWMRAEQSQRAARGVARGWWAGALATVVGGGLGAVIGHLWR
jgi:hypothetical protein